MLAKLRPRSAYDVMAALSLFLVVAGGSAYATHELILSSDIVDGEVKTPDIANAAVVTDKLAQAAVTSGKVKNDNLVGGDILDESLTGLDVADNTLKGADVDEPTLDQVPAAVLGGKGRSAGGNGFACDPESAAFVDCGFVRLDIPAQSRTRGTRVLVTGAITGFIELNVEEDGEGACRLHTSPPGGPATPLVQTETPFLVSDEARGDYTEVGAMMAVTPPLGPGTVDFGIECAEFNSGLDFVSAKIAAVAISPN
jgi:hypothetical protein